MKEDDEPVKILIADDDKDDQELFSDALDESGIPSELETFDNGKELMDNLHDPAEPNPDLIVLDMNMPLKDGKECLKEIKADPELCNIPTVMFTTSNNEHDINETYEAGANLFVQKPTIFSKMVSIIKKILTLDWKDFFPRPLRERFFVSEKTIGKD